MPLPDAAGLGYALALLGLLSAQRLVPFASLWRSGLPALSRILAPYLFLPLLLWIPSALRRRPHVVWLRAGLLLCVIAFVACFPPHFPASASNASANDAPDARTLVAMTWNVWTTNAQEAAFFDYLKAQPADLIAFQECDWTALVADESLAQRYPHQLVYPKDGLPPGTALLSIYPITDYGTLSGPASVWDIPRVLWARLDVGQGQSLVVVVAHPRPPRLFGLDCGVICSQQRDAQVSALAELATDFAAQGEPLLVLGDLNLTEREVAYAELTDDLVDAQRRVGRGWGHTWGTLGWLPLLRLDYMLSSTDLVPLSLDVDCDAPGSDHCRVLGRFALANSEK